jgi:hypothetical protein
MEDWVVSFPVKNPVMDEAFGLGSIRGIGL